MRELLTTVDPSLWSEISAGFFGLCFLALVCWVFLPSRDKFYKQHSRLPLDTD